jgi:hypothetical protein
VLKGMIRSISTYMSNKS